MQLIMFVDERCVRHRTAWVSLADAYAAYQEWAQDNGEEPLSKRRFSAQLEGAGCKKVRRRAGFGLLGLGLAAEEPTAPGKKRFGLIPWINDGTQRISTG